MPVFLSGYCLNSFLTLITMLGHPWYHWNCSLRGYSWPPNCWIKCDFPFLNSFECSAVTDVKHSCFLKHSPIVIPDTTLFSFHIYLFNNPLSICFDRHCSQIIGVLQGSPSTHTFCSVCCLYCLICGCSFNSHPYTNDFQISNSSLNHSPGL